MDPAVPRPWRISMGSFSIWHWLIVGIVVLVLFGKGRIADVMGDFGKGIKSFKKGMAEEDEPARRITEEKKLESPMERSPTLDPEQRREP
jgi:sec-independent protein translocase protein TatA